MQNPSTTHKTFRWCRTPAPPIRASGGAVGGSPSCVASCGLSRCLWGRLLCHVTRHQRCVCYSAAHRKALLFLRHSRGEKTSSKSSSSVVILMQHMFQTDSLSPSVPIPVLNSKRLWNQSWGMDTPRVLISCWCYCGSNSLFQTLFSAAQMTHSHETTAWAMDQTSYWRTIPIAFPPITSNDNCKQWQNEQAFLKSSSSVLVGSLVPAEGRDFLLPHIETMWWRARSEPSSGSQLTDRKRHERLLLVTSGNYKQ